MNKNTQKIIYNAIFKHKQFRLTNVKICYTLNSIYYFIVLLVVLSVLFHRFIIQLGCPEVFKYSLDGLNVLAFAFSLFNYKRNKQMFFSISVTILFFILFGTLAIINGVHYFQFTLSNYLFDIRNVLRPFMFFFSCCTLLKFDQIEKIKNILIAYHLVNFVYIVYQYFTLEVWAYWMRGDNLNGFFGTATGGNIYVNVMCIVTSIISLERFKEKKFTVFHSYFILSLNLLLATLIELKMYYFEFAIIVGIFVFEIKLRKKMTTNKIIVILISIICIPFIIYGMVLLMYKIYPSMAGSLSLQGILKTTSQDGYTGRYDLNRLSFIKGINKSIFHNNKFLNMFGLGLGMANTNSSFFDLYDNTHYTWFSSAYVYIENGITGLILYLLSFYIVLIFCNNQNKYYKKSIISTILMITVVFFYNETMKTEANYLLVFLLASYFSEKTKRFTSYDLKTIT